MKKIVFYIKLFINIVGKTLSTNQKQKKHDGFESYNVPRIDNIVSKTESINMRDFNKNCLKSFSKGFYTKEKNNETINEKITKENERLKEILLEQTDTNWLANSKLPKISYIVTQPHIIIKRTGVGLNKYMGQKYNPHNYNSGNPKSLTRTNFVGSLYQH